MAEVVVYHHVQGLTGGMVALADDLRRAGHVVHTPDMFDGRTFGSIEEGMAFAREAGFDALTQRGAWRPPRRSGPTSSTSASRSG